MKEEDPIIRLKEIYGPEKGMQIYMNIMPGILADFTQLLNAADPGQRVEEEYILEDQKARLRLVGEKKKHGAPDIEIRVLQ